MLWRRKGKSSITGASLPGPTGSGRAEGAWPSFDAPMRFTQPAGPRILGAFADAYPRAVFVEIGANDGVRTDHLRPFILSCPWRGVMVEPVPWLYERLRENYKTQLGVAFENAAIAGVDAPVPFYYVPPAENRLWGNGPIWSDVVGSLSRAEVEGSIAHGRDFAAQALRVEIPDHEIRIEKINVPGLTFESLCRKHSLEALDLVLIDAEGYDYEIIKEIDFERHRPRLLIYESDRFSPEQRQECRAYLERLGYDPMEEGFDTWCHDPRVNDGLTRRWRTVRRRQRVSALLPRSRLRREQELVVLRDLHGEQM